MRIKQIIVTMAALMIQLTAAAQSNITGVLADSITLEGEPYATIRVFKGKNMKEPVAMSVSDIKGNFKQTVNGKGNFTITFNSVGRKEVQRNLTLDGKTTIDLGTVLISDDAQQLQGVEVVAQKPLVKMETDKMSYNVQDDVDSKTSTVLDMLRKVPMVTVDGQDNITVNGSSSFKVYVNGKPNMMFNSNPSQIFKAMPATTVKNIEVITNPGAKYDAEGTGGVLNIIMAGQGGQDTSVDGINGNVRLTAGSKQNNAGVFVSGQYGKFSFSANAIANEGKTKGTEIEIERESLTDGSLMSYKQESDTKMPFYLGDLHLGYELDSMSTINGSFGYRRFGMKNSGDPTTTMTGGIYGNGFSYGQWMKSKNIQASFDASIDYQRFLNKDKTSSITLIYLFNLNPTNNDSWNKYKTEGMVLPVDVTDRYSHSKEKSTEHTFQVDYTTPLAKNHTLNTGMKLTLRNNSSDSKFYLGKDDDYVYNESLSMDYSHYNSILAGYAEYEGKYGKVGTKAGLRYEHTWQDVEYRLGNGENFKSDYGNLVPTANLSYQLMPFANIGLTYNLRISRPGISYLNPYVDRSSNTELSYGNPDLEVEKTHNVGLVFNMYTPFVMGNLNIQHSFTDNGISQYSFYQDGLLNTTYGNVVRQHNTTASLWLSLMLSKDTRIFMNGGIGYIDMRSNELDARNHGWQSNIMAGIQQTLPWELKGGIFMIANSKNYTLQGWRSGFSMLMGNLNKSFLNDKLNVGIQAMTGLRKKGMFYFDSYSQGKDFINRQNIHVPIANVSLNITWNFGNSKVKAKVKSSNVNSDVIEKKNDMEQMNGMGSGVGTGF